MTRERMYSVAVETGKGPMRSTEALDALVDALAAAVKGGRALAASASWGGLAAGPGSQIDVSAPDPGMAASRAVAVLESVLRDAGIAGARVVRVDVMEEEYLEAWLAREPDPLVGVSEIAERLGVSKQRVSELRTRQDFPRAVAELAAGPVWTSSSLNHFVAGWSRRPGRPSKEGSNVRALKRKGLVTPAKKPKGPAPRPKAKGLGNLSDVVIRQRRR